MSSSATAVNIPVIDISILDQATGDKLVAATANYGFVFIKSTGLDLDVNAVNVAFELARSFFHAPLEEKETCAMTKNNRGWISMHSELLDPENQKRGDFKEAFNFGEFVDGKAQQPLSKSLTSYEAQISQFSGFCRSICLQVLRLFAIGLKIPTDHGGSEWFASRHDPSKGPSGTILRILYYPALPSTTPHFNDLRAGAHSDYGSLTLLFRLRGQPGLEILTQSNEWAAVPVTPPGTEDDPYPPILINIGDLLSYWTGGMLKSTVHRVSFPKCSSVARATGSAKEDNGQDRYSIAYFFHPCEDTELVPVPSPMVQSELGQGDGMAKVLTASEHLQSRLAATYGWNKKKMST